MNIAYALQVVLRFCPSHSTSDEWTRRRSIHINDSHFPGSNTLREQSSIKIIMKNGNGIELESKRCADLDSSTYIYWFKCKLLRPFTPSPGGESFPSSVRQRKWIKELYINYLLSVNERKVADNAIMIEITSGGIPACPPTSQGVYVRSPWLVLLLCQA